MADWTLGSRPSISGHPSIWAWFDNKHLTPASLLAFSLQPSKGPGSSNLDLHDFDHFSEVFCFICCPPGLTSTYLKIHQTLEMKEREIRRKTWLVQQMAITPGKLQRRKQTCHHGYWKLTLITSVHELCNWNGYRLAPQTRVNSYCWAFWVLGTVKSKNSTRTQKQRTLLGFISNPSINCDQ